MPSPGIPLLPREDILTFEEIHAVVSAAAEMGVGKVRLTGGEPTVRARLPELVRLISGIPGIDDISMTTNGLMLAKLAARLKQAGLCRVNVSLDSLVPEKFSSITRGDGLQAVLDGINAARQAGLNPVKINFVVMAGINDDEIPAFAGKTISDGWHVRFIERMPFTGEGAAGKFMPMSDIRQRLEQIDRLEPCVVNGNGPAKYFRFPGAGGTIGFITPVSDHFCFHCNRLRLTADGKLRPCLLSPREIDLRQALRQGASRAELKRLIEAAVAEKPAGHSMTPDCATLNRPFSQIGG